MKRTTIFADDWLMEEIKAIADEENRATAEVVREAMEQYIQEKRKKKTPLSFVGAGASGKDTISEDHEELLWKKITE